MGIFTVTFYQPIYNLLVWMYQIIPGADIGIVIILMTIVVKGALFPLTFRMLKSQKQMQELQPKIAKIREEHKEDREKMAAELMAIYKENKVNPFASCLPLLIQLPIFLALYQVLRDGLGEVNTDLLYGFVSNPGTLDATSFGFDLTQISIPLAIATAVLQYFQAKQALNRRPAKEASKSSGAMDEQMQATMGKMMMYFIPAFTLMLGATSLPAGVMLYWMTTTLLTIILYKVFLGDKKKEATSEKE